MEEKELNLDLAKEIVDSFVNKQFCYIEAMEILTATMALITEQVCTSSDTYSRSYELTINGAMDVIITIAAKRAEVLQ